MRKRLQVYQSQTRPLVDYYSGWAATGDASAPRYARVVGTGTVDEITGRVLAALDPAAAGFDSDQAHRFLLEKIKEETDRIRTAAHTRNHLVGQPALAGEELGLRFLADHAVKIAHHHRIRV